MEANELEAQALLVARAMNSANLAQRESALWCAWVSSMLQAGPARQIIPDSFAKTADELLELWRSRFQHRCHPDPVALTAPMGPAQGSA